MRREVMEWIDATLCGDISPEDFARLQEALKSDPIAFDHYCRQAELHGRLEWEFSEPQRQALAVSEPSRPIENAPRPGLRTHGPWIAAAAAVALLAGLLVHLVRQSPAPATAGPGEDPALINPVNGETQIPGTSVARLTKVLEANWESGDLRLGSWLSPGKVHLTAGSAEISFDSGARVVLEAPASFELLTTHHARLLRGRGTVHITWQASGFVLDTPSTTFSDLDSSFSLAVDERGETEIHVLRGLVEATPRGNTALATVLSGNEAARLSYSDILGPERVKYAAGSFSPELPASEGAGASSFLYWSFDEADPGRVAETGSHPGNPFPARILARPGTSQHASAEFVDGRFGKAIQLNGRGAFLSSDFPGIPGSQPRTVAFWVRVPPNLELHQAYSMIAWGQPASRAGGKWQVSWNMAAQPGLDSHGTKGAIRTEFGGGFVVGETDLRDGQWHHVAVVFLGGKTKDVASRIRHYIDGRLEAVTAFHGQTVNTQLTNQRSLPTYIGRRLENDFPDYSFKGAIDELYIFPSALTPEQITALQADNSTPTSFVASQADAR